jgi:hypothetical protein
MCAVQLAQCTGLLLPYEKELLLVLQLLPELLIRTPQLLYFTAGQRRTPCRAAGSVACTPVNCDESDSMRHIE